MAKEVINIEHFHAGIYGGVDERDIPLDAFAYAENLNPAAVQGKLSGIETNQTVVTAAAYEAAIGGTAGATNVSAAVNYEDGDSVVGIDPVSENVFEITDIDGTPAFTDLGSFPSIVGTPKAVVSDGAAVHVGMGGGINAPLPRWVGEIDYGHFNNAIPEQAGVTRITEDTLRAAPHAITPGAEFVHVAASNPVDAGTEDEALFQAGKGYYYYIVIQYDGYQEGPLFHDRTANLEWNVTQNRKSVDLDFTVDETEIEWNPRISGLVIYRGESFWAEATGARSDDEPAYVGTIDLNDTGWTGTTGAYTFTFTDSVSAGDSYSDRNGLSAAQEDMTFYYGLSCASEQYQFIADVVTNVSGKSFDEAQRAVFRSQPYKFSMFDKTEFVLLPVKPVALAAFAGRVYAFSSNTLTPIDGTTLNKGQEIHGIGTFGPDSVVVTDRGMLFCDENNIYITDPEGRITPIGNPVLYNEVDSKAAYLSRDVTVTPVVTYDSRLDAYIVAYKNSAGTISLLTYRPQQRQTIDLPQGRWDHVLTTATTLGTRIPSNRTRPLLVLDGDIVELFGSATKSAWAATLRLFTTPERSKYYHARIDGDSVTVEYSEDEGAFSTATLTPDGGTTFRARVNGRTSGPWNTVKSHQVRLSGSSAQEVNRLSITRRRMEQI